MTMTLNRNIVAAIIAFSLLVTAYNTVQNPIEWEIEETNTKHYGGAGISFELQKGMRFNFTKNRENYYLSYMEGYMYRLRYDNETTLPSIALTWREWEPMNFTEAVKRSYNYSDVRFTDYSFDGYVNTTINDHIFQYQSFNKSTTEENRTGYVGFWNCTNSGRIMTLMVENDVNGDLTGLFDLFNDTRTTLNCHYPGQTPSRDDELDLPFDIGTVVNVVFMIMMTVGFTFTYMMEGFPNFAHTSYATICAMVSFYLTRFLNFQPYDTWVFAAFVGGLIGVGLYLGVVRPIRRNGGYQDITLTFTFLVIAMVLPQFAYIFNWWARYEVSGGSAVRGYNLRYFDFSYRGIPGIAITSVATCILLILWLKYFLTQDKNGLGLRAVAENEPLAATIGINTHRAHLLSWFISGALSALVGSIMTMYSSVSVGGPDGLIVNVMSGAILGGVTNVYGAIIGGLFVALAQDMLKDLFFIFFGLAVEKWQGLLPMVFLITSLTLFPNGIIGVEGVSMEKIRIAYEKLRKRLFK